MGPSTPLGDELGVGRLVALAALISTQAMAGPFVEGFFGASQSAPGTLTIVQNGHEPERVAARWENDAFVSPPYWAVRGGWSFRSVELSAELVHHKLLLRPPVEPVQQFAITHGFNLVLLSVAWKLEGDMLARLGAGLVVAHPENTVRGVTIGYGGGDFSGFLLTGPAVSAGLQRRWWLTRWFALSVELAVSGAWARVPVAGGHADLADFAVHARIGVAIGRRP